MQVAVPQDTPDEEVRDIVRRRAPWILAHAPETLLEALPKRFVSGETLPYLGRNVRMVVVVGDVPSPEVRFDHWRLRITVPRDLPGESRPERIRKAIVAWYRRRAEARLATIVDRWWPRFGGREPYRLLIRDQRQRWGSCAPDGTLRFNWRLAMLRPDLAEYVVVHELAHLRVRNHSAPSSGPCCPGQCPTPRSAAAGCGRWASHCLYNDLIKRAWRLLRAPSLREKKAI